MAVSTVFPRSRARHSNLAAVILAAGLMLPALVTAGDAPEPDVIAANDAFRKAQEYDVSGDTYRALIQYSRAAQLDPSLLHQRTLNDRLQAIPVPRYHEVKGWYRRRSEGDELGYTYPQDARDVAPLVFQRHIDGENPVVLLTVVPDEQDNAEGLLVLQSRDGKRFNSYQYLVDGFDERLSGLPVNITVRDWDFDYFPDFDVDLGASSEDAPRQHNVYVYDPVSREFRKSASLSSLTDASLDYKQNRILEADCASRDACTNNAYVLNRDGNLVLVARRTTACGISETGAKRCVHDDIVFAGSDYLVTAPVYVNYRKEEQYNTFDKVVMSWLEVRNGVLADDGGDFRWAPKAGVGVTISGELNEAQAKQITNLIERHAR